MIKILNFIMILFIFIINPCKEIFSQELNVFVIDDFSKGLNTHVNEYGLNKGEASLLRNVRVNNLVGSISKRSRMSQYGIPAAHAITGLYRYYNSSEDEILIAGGSTKLYYGNDSTGVFTTLAQGLTDGQRWQFETYKDVLIASNGIDNIIKWDGSTLATPNTDGHRTAGDLCSELGAPLAELNTGTDLDASSWYMYKVAYYDGTSYYYSTARSNPILTGSTVHNITLTDIPIGASGTTARYIYRTSGHSSRTNVLATSDYYLVTTIADNTTRTYNDASSDATIEVDNPPTWSTVSAGNDVSPPTGKYLKVVSERLFVSGNGTYQSDVYWSDIYNPDYFLATDYEQFRPDDGDKITFLEVLYGNLIIGKKNSIQKFFVKGSTATDWTKSDPFTHIGCHAPYTAINTPDGLIYLNKQGIYLFNGQSPQLLSDKVTPQIKDISPSDIENCWGVYNNNKYYLSYQSESSGVTLNDKILILNFLRQAWVKDIKYVNCMTVLSGGNDKGVVYFGSSNTDGKVWASEEEEPLFRVRRKSELDLGTYTEARTIGAEKSPVMEIAWGITIDDWDTYGATINDLPGIIDRPDTDGDWESPGYQINANSMGLLYWNENLKTSGDITVSIRTASTEAGLAVASYTSFTDPSGVDISSVTGDNFMQVKVELETSNIIESPELYYFNGYVFKIIYYTVTSTFEGDYTSYWESGWLNFGVNGLEKNIKKIKIYYQGTSGTLNFQIENLKTNIEHNDVNNIIEINLAIDPIEDLDDNYTGNGEYKIYNYYPALDVIGERFKFTLEEEGTSSWNVDRIEIIYSIEEIMDI